MDQQLLLTASLLGGLFAFLWLLRANDERRWARQRKAEELGGGQPGD
ncbi:MAG: hypothetical protein K2P95_08815 [Hyphomonadaceae bacterium]|nr:hypothetical protein [Hyphomonadaceae bacterium]